MILQNPPLCHNKGFYVPFMYVCFLLSWDTKYFAPILLGFFVFFWYVDIQLLTSDLMNNMTCVQSISIIDKAWWKPFMILIFTISALLLHSNFKFDEKKCEQCAEILEWTLSNKFKHIPDFITSFNWEHYSFFISQVHLKTCYCEFIFFSFIWNYFVVYWLANHYFIQSE